MQWRFLKKPKLKEETSKYIPNKKEKLYKITILLLLFSFIMRFKLKKSYI